MNSAMADAPEPAQEFVEGFALGQLGICCTLRAPDGSPTKDYWFSALSARLPLEVASSLEIGDKPGLNRMPSQPFLRQRAGRWAVHCEEVSDPSKMAGSFFRRLRDNGH